LCWGFRGGGELPWLIRDGFNVEILRQGVGMGALPNADMCSMCFKSEVWKGKRVDFVKLDRSRTFGFRPHACVQGVWIRG